jgi:hypothetical protein
MGSSSSPPSALYYLGSEAVRPWLSLVHVTVGLAVPALLAAHVLVGRGIFYSPATSATPLRRMPPSIAVTLVPDGGATAVASSFIATGGGMSGASAAISMRAQ